MNNNKEKIKKKEKYQINRIWEIINNQEIRIASLEKQIGSYNILQKAIDEIRKLVGEIK